MTAAKKLGIKVVTNVQGWDPKASSYEALAKAIKKSGAKAVFLGGIVCNNGAKLMQDIKSVNPQDPAADARRLQRSVSRPTVRLPTARSSASPASRRRR